MDETVVRAKIRPPISFHGLGNTWASHAVMTGMPLMVVVPNLGHPIRGEAEHDDRAYINPEVELYTSR
jgi:hypothetical protein